LTQKAFDKVKAIYPTFTPEIHTFLAHFLVDQVKSLRLELAIANSIPVEEELHGALVEKVKERMKTVDVVVLGHLTISSFNFMSLL
jgi:hypothetical protein